MWQMAGIQRTLAPKMNERQVLDRGSPQQATAMSSEADKINRNCWHVQMALLSAQRFANISNAAAVSASLAVAITFSASGAQ